MEHIVQLECEVVGCEAELLVNQIPVWRLTDLPTISTPVNPARSTTKLLSNANQLLKATGMATDIRINRFLAVCQECFCIGAAYAGGLPRSNFGDECKDCCKTRYISVHCYIQCTAWRKPKYRH